MVRFHRLSLAGVDTSAFVGRSNVAEDAVKARDWLASLIDLQERANQRLKRSSSEYDFLANELDVHLDGYDEIDGTVVPPTTVKGNAALRECVYALMVELDNLVESTPLDVNLMRVRDYLRDSLGLSEVVNIGKKILVIADEDSMIVNTAGRIVGGAGGPLMTDIAFQRVLIMAVRRHHEDGLDCFLNLVKWPNVMNPSEPWELSRAFYDESPDGALCRVMHTGRFLFDAYDSGAVARAAIFRKTIINLAGNFGLDPNLSLLGMVTRIQLCRVRDQKLRMDQALADQWQRLRADFDRELGEKEQQLNEERLEMEDDVRYWRHRDTEANQRIDMLEGLLQSLEDENRRLKERVISLESFLSDDDASLFSSPDEKENNISMDDSK